MPDDSDFRGILKMCTNGSPKLRFLCLIIAELCILLGEKLIIFVTLPAQQLWLEKLLQAAGLKARACKLRFHPHPLSLHID